MGVAYRIVKQILNARMGILALLGAYQQIYLCHLGDAQQFLDDDCGNKSIVSGGVDELDEPVCVLKYAQHVHAHTHTGSRVYLLLPKNPVPPVRKMPLSL